jgi:hypothetical protein
MFSDVPHQGVRLCHMDRFMQGRGCRRGGLAFADLQHNVSFLKIMHFLTVIYCIHQYNADS